MNDSTNQRRGTLRRLVSGWEARVRVADDGTKRGFALSGLPARNDETSARERCTVIAEAALRLRRAGCDRSELEKLLELAARARPGRPLDAVLSAVDALCSGMTEPLSESARVTVKAFGADWRSGALHRKHPDHVPAIDHTRNEEIARLYVDGIIGDRRIAEVTLDDCEEVMSAIPAARSSATRRHVAQYVRRLLGLSVYPGRIRAANPVPKGWLPKVRDAKAKECLYPDEDRLLLSCRAIPVARRLAYGFLAREGMRTDELARLEWRDVDIERGRVDLDENKTDDPRAWDLDPGVARALAAWRFRYCRQAGPRDRVMSADGDAPLSFANAAKQLRRDLQHAGVTREKLFERSPTRQPLRAHDLRATFITISLATGATETWVADRTGHKSSTMINRYRRRARTWKLGLLDPLDRAIPELAHDERHSGVSDVHVDSSASSSGARPARAASARRLGTALGARRADHARTMARASVAPGARARQENAAILGGTRPASTRDPIQNPPSSRA